MAKRHRHLLGPLDVTRAKPKKSLFGSLTAVASTSGCRRPESRLGSSDTATAASRRRPRSGKCSDARGRAWARAKADEARGRVEEGDHLTRVKAVKKATKRAASGNTFATVAAPWVKNEARRAQWTPDYREEVASSLANHLSELNPLPLAEIIAAMAAPHLRKVERNAPDMAKKVRQRLRSIPDYAVEDGIIPGNPIPTPRRRKKAEGRPHLPAVLAEEGVGAILR